VDRGIAHEAKNKQRRKVKNDIIPINGNQKGGDGYRLPFGKHKGQRLGTIPTNYLRWLVAQEWVSEYCRCELMEELGRRGELFDEMVMQIINLKAQVEHLRRQLHEAEQRNHRADLETAPADHEFARELRRTADSA
jgi:uncharacterized protein (DUF3820 family)